MIDSENNLLSEKCDDQSERQPPQCLSNSCGGGAGKGGARLKGKIVTVERIFSAKSELINY